jgi:hypothetical protein
MYCECTRILPEHKKKCLPCIQYPRQRKLNTFLIAYGSYAEHDHKEENIKNLPTHTLKLKCGSNSRKIFDKWEAGMYVQPSTVKSRQKRSIAYRAFLRETNKQYKV